MSISGALANALSGLTASARAANVVSSNLANIHTDGYVRRDIELATNIPGTHGGVRVLGVTRHVDQGVLGDRRLADAGLANAQTRSAFLSRMQSSIGTPDKPESLSARIAALEASLVTATSRPDAPERLQAAVQDASNLLKGFNTISKEIQTSRMRAEEEIQGAIRALNTSLAQARSLNFEIAEAARQGQDTTALLDQRQIVVDRIAEIVPVQEIPRDHGAMALVTPTGALLLDGRALQLDFVRSNVITPHMRLENGLLSGLTLDGESVVMSGAHSPIAGGRLAALFEIRDDLAVTAQSRVDSLARSLVERFQQPGLDPTRAPGDAGLFTDTGATFAAANEIGLAGRLALNPRVDPGAGGAAWRLRDGLGAAVPGAIGNAALLGQYTDVLADRQSLTSGDFGGAAATLAVHAGALASVVAQDFLAAEQTLSFASSRQAGLQSMLLRDGVDSDAETQQLLLIEQAYAANARMIQTLDEMMQTLLRI